MGHAEARAMNSNAYAQRDPMAAVFAIRSVAPTGPPQILAWLGVTAALYATMTSSALLLGVWGLEEWAMESNAFIRGKLGAPIEVAVQSEVPPTAPVVAPPDPTPAPKDPAPSPAPLPNAAPPAGAAANVVAANDPVADFGDKWSMPVGTASAYTGQVTAPSGTGTVPTSNTNARPDGTPGGTGTGPGGPPPPPPVDKSRRVTAVVKSWSCPFPPEADVAQIDHARVLVTVQVRLDGGAAGASPASDPGNGFGRAAAQCAMRQRFNPALDKEGNPIASTWQGYVSFDR